MLKEKIRMINEGIVPDGYKKTKVGIVPQEWRVCHFKEMFSRLKRRNTENNTNVLTISAQYGLINQEEFFNKSVASEDKSNYYLLYKGDFAYNKSYSNGYPFGAIKSLDKYDKGVVSPLYICFSPTDKNKCPEFYLQYFENGLMNREIQAIAQEGARNHGLLNIGVEDFFNSYLLLPTEEEQEKIAAILSTQDELISLQERKIEELKELKKAYLQKMFPQNGSKYPELRFKGFTDAWEQRKLGDHSEIVAGGTPNTGHPEYWNPKEIPWMSSGEINNKVIYSTDNMISKIGFSNSSAKWVKEKSVLIALAGQGKTRGTVAISEIPLTTNQSIAAIQPDSFLYYKFLFQNLEGRYNELREVSSGDGTRGGLNKQIISDLEVLAPEIQEQIKIGDFLCGIDNLITLHQRKLESEKKKKKSLMQLLLTGKVRV